jgi:ComF family protein
MPKTKYWNEPDNELEKLFWGKVHVERACALFFYRIGSSYRPLIHKFKYQGNYSLAIRLGEDLGSYLNGLDSYRGIDMLVPVPLHPRKERKRGYNQSEQIAKGISNVMQIPVETRSLIRMVYTETQTKKNKLERRENVKEVFKVKDVKLFEDKHVMLIDDVITTGATIEACALALQENCRCKVSIASLGFVYN